jgi:hypothetical protein
MGWTVGGILFEVLAAVIPCHPRENGGKAEIQQKKIEAANDLSAKKHARRVKQANER